jgi:hypothetical protein
MFRVPVQRKQFHPPEGLTTVRFQVVSVSCAPQARPGTTEISHPQNGQLRQYSAAGVRELGAQLGGRPGPGRDGTGNLAHGIFRCL